MNWSGYQFFFNIHIFVIAKMIQYIKIKIDEY